MKYPATDKLQQNYVSHFTGGGCCHVVTPSHRVSNTLPVFQKQSWLRICSSTCAELSPLQRKPLFQEQCPAGNRFITTMPRRGHHGNAVLLSMLTRARQPQTAIPVSK